MNGGSLTITGTWFGGEGAASVTVGGAACKITASSLPAAPAAQTLTCTAPASTTPGSAAVVVSVNSVASTETMSVTYSECDALVPAQPAAHRHGETQQLMVCCLLLPLPCLQTALLCLVHHLLTSPWLAVP